MISEECKSEHSFIGHVFKAITVYIQIYIYPFKMISFTFRNHKCIFRFHIYCWSLDF